MTDHDDDHDEDTGEHESAESSGDEDSESCPICLLRLKLQLVGRPEQCKHLFCLACITQWSKVKFKILSL